MNFGWEAHSVESFDLEEPFIEHSGYSLAALHQVIKMVPLMVMVELDFNSFKA